MNIFLVIPAEILLSWLYVPSKMKTNDSENRTLRLVYTQDNTEILFIPGNTIYEAGNFFLSLFCLHCGEYNFLFNHNSTRGGGGAICTTYISSGLGGLG